MMTHTQPQAFQVLGAVCLAICLTGCGRGSGLELERCPVRGTVTTNGAPLRCGRIVFTPTTGTHGPAASALVETGMYRIRDEEGLVPGEYRVEIHITPDAGFSLDDDVAFAQRAIARRGKPLMAAVLPARFNSESTLKAEVRGGDVKNEFHFPLTFKPPVLARK